MTYVRAIMKGIEIVTIIIYTMRVHRASIADNIIMFKQTEIIIASRPFFSEISDRLARCNNIMRCVFAQERRDSNN